MIIYFADRQLNLNAQASTNLPGGFHITEDKLTEDIDSGINVFTFKVMYEDWNRRDLESAGSVGNFVFRGGDVSDAEGYNSLFQIVDTELDTSYKTITITAEDAGLELINRISPAVKLENKTLGEMLNYFIPSDWTLNLITTPSGKKTNEWEGENTTTERVNSVVGLFDCEAYYTFKIERMRVTGKILNVIPKRGNQQAVEQLRLNVDVNKITIKTSIADIATAFEVKGSISGKSYVNLKGYSYEYTDPTNGDVYSVDSNTGQMRNLTAMRRWMSAIDRDGLILKTFEFDTKDKATLAGQARAELQKVSHAIVEYEVEFAHLSNSVRIGDRVNIIDERGELYLDARILVLETSVITQTKTATIGEYILRDSGLDPNIKALADKISSIEIGETPIRIELIAKDVPGSSNESTLTATIWKGNAAITQASALEEGEFISWYKDGDHILGADNTFLITVNLNESTNYSCKLMKED